MTETKYFELIGAESFQAYNIMSIIAGRCAGENVDPDTNESWAKFKNVDISIIRSSKPMPAAMNNHNQISDYLWEFTVKELAEDYISSDTNPFVEQIGHTVARLPIGRTSSHYFIKVVVS